jgi:hypothetical protein
MKRILGFFFLILVTFEARARELYEYNVPIRARGMGGVSTPFPRATHALFTNPAYLCNVDEIGWEIANLGIGLNGVQTTATGLSIDTSLTDLSSVSSPSDYDAFFGKRIWFMGSGYSSVVLPCFGFGYFNNTNTAIVFDNPVFPDFNIDFINDSGYQMGFAIPMGLMSTGFSVRQVRRWGGPLSIGLSTVTSGSFTGLEDQIQNTGNGVGLDMAMMAKLPTPVVSPTLAFVWKDVGTTVFTRTNGSDNPPRIADNMILGVGTVVDAAVIEWSTGLEFQYINDRDVQLSKKFHLGTEVSMPFIDLRAGISQGYQTWGLGLDLFLFRFDAAYYGVERGEYPGQSLDNRIEASFSFQIAIDADFGFNEKGADGKSGRRRKLKQRR